MRYVIVVMIFLVTACGGETTATTETTVPTTSSTTLPATTTAPATQAVFVNFGVDSPTSCSEVVGYQRVVSADVDPIEAAFRELVGGPTPAESDAGASSWFTNETQNMLRSTRLDNGRLIVDFDDFSAVIPNASTSCGSARLLAELSTTAFQFPDVESVTFSFEGSCEAFGEFLQMGCVEIDREGPDDGYVEYRADPNLVPPDPLPGSDDAAGSGCSPGEGPLPDGVWFGMAEEITSDGIRFDLACFFFGDAANEAAAEDGVEEIPVPNDYYIRNQVGTLRLVPVPATAMVHTLGTSIDDGFETITFSTWGEQEDGFLICPGESCLVWLYVNGGRVTEIVEQYTP